ncbi:MAG: RDD family protein [Prosthecobacter sp.]|nr:RDD family protein [Prosthecobacter sp.]
MKYHLARGEEQLGTFSDLDVSAGLRNGRFQPGDLCWTEGMKDWQTLETHMQDVAEETGTAQEPAIAALEAEVRKDQSTRLELASLGQRLAAALVDLASILVPMMIMFSVLIDERFEAEIRAVQNDPQAVMDALQRQIEKVQATGNSTLMMLGWFMDVLVITNIILLTVRGQTLGKLLLGIQVVRSADDSRAGFLRAVLLRSLLLIFVLFLPHVGPFLLIADVLLIFRADRRCLHDFIADTRVVLRPRKPQDT